MKIKYLTIFVFGLCGITSGREPQPTEPIDTQISVYQNLQQVSKFPECKGYDLPNWAEKVTPSTILNGEVMYCMLQLMSKELQKYKQLKSVDFTESPLLTETIELMLSKEKEDLEGRISRLEIEMEEKSTSLAKEIESVTIDLQHEFLSIREELSEVGEYYMVATKENEKAIEKVAAETKLKLDELESRLNAEIEKSQEKDVSMLTNFVTEIEALRQDTESSRQKLETTFEAKMTEEINRAQEVEKSLREVIALVYKQNVAMQDEQKTLGAETSDKIKLFETGLTEQNARWSTVEENFNSKIQLIETNLKQEIASFSDQGQTAVKALDERITDLFQKSKQLQYTVKLMIEKEVFRAQQAEHTLNTALAMERKRALDEETRIFQMASETSQSWNLKKSQLQTMEKNDQEISQKLENVVGVLAENRKHLEILQNEMDLWKRYHWLRENEQQNRGGNPSVMQKLGSFFSRYSSK